MPLRKRNYQEPMSHDYLQEMIVAAAADGTPVTMTVREAEALMDEFAFDVARIAKLDAELKQVLCDWQKSREP